MMFVLVMSVFFVMFMFVMFVFFVFGSFVMPTGRVACRLGVGLASTAGRVGRDRRLQRFFLAMRFQDDHAPALVLPAFLFFARAPDFVAQIVLALRLLHGHLQVVGTAAHVALARTAVALRRRGGRALAVVMVMAAAGAVMVVVMVTVVVVIVVVVTVVMTTLVVVTNAFEARIVHVRFAVV